LQRRSNDGADAVKQRRGAMMRTYANDAGGDDFQRRGNDVM
jgi:hypothetical protein